MLMKVLLGIFSLIILLSGQQIYAAQGSINNSKEEFVSNQILVKVNKQVKSNLRENTVNTGAASLDEKFKKHKVEKFERTFKVNDNKNTDEISSWYTITLPGNPQKITGFNKDTLKFDSTDPQVKELETILMDLRQDPNIEMIELNGIGYGAAITNDPQLFSQWGMFKINVASSSGQSAWNVTQGSQSVNVAILDSGIDRNHPDMVGKVISNINFSDSPTDNDILGHGTHVASTIASATNNSTGVAGVGYNTKLMNVKVLNDSDFGFYSWWGNGIIWAAQNGARVINMSLAGNSPSTFLEDSINYVWNNYNVVVIAAAGNNGSVTPMYPAYYSNAIAVAATDENDNKAFFSNYGSWVDIAAPGVNILSATRGGYEYWNGTSMAAPHVSGVAALIWATGECFSSVCVREKIEKNTDTVSGTGVYWNNGRLNAYKAVTSKNIAYNLTTGWNMIGIPVSTTTTPTQFVSLTSNKCPVVIGINPNTQENLIYTLYPEAFGPNTLTSLSPGQGYVVYCLDNTSFTLTGSPIADYQPISTGVQIVTIPEVKNNILVEEYLQEVAVKQPSLSCVAVVKLNRTTQEYILHFKTQSENNFAMNYTEGYILFCE